MRVLGEFPEESADSLLSAAEVLHASRDWETPAGGTHSIGVSMSRDVGGEFTLAVRDNGVGLPDDFEVERTGTMGMKILSTLVRQMNGSLRVESGPGAGFVITFKEPELNS